MTGATLLKGAEGDALHVIACAAGYNIRWLLRWIVFLWAWIRAIANADTSSRQPLRLGCLA
ncbi:hypothetical protein [Coralloluteibacterium stylophorae]|uniref:hypothetical protein n=1 Tax=Coralloluteibacterium stylophorae TaxID=1776034 RepID=UPI003CCE2E25